MTTYLRGSCLVLASCSAALTIKPSSPSMGVDPRHLTQWITKSSSVTDLVTLHAQHGHDFNDIHLSAAWVALGRLCSDRGSASASKHGYTRFRSMPLRLQSALKPLMGRSARMALAGSLTGRELANVIYGVAKSRLTDGPTRTGLLDALAAVAISTRLANLKPQELSNICWAYATAGHEAPALFDALAEEAELQCHLFNPQELSNVGWSFATAEHQAPRLLDAVAEASLASLPAFNAQNLANTAWAFSKLGHTSPALFDAIALAASEQAPSLNPQNLANMAFA